MAIGNVTHNGKTYYGIVTIKDLQNKCKGVFNSSSNTSKCPTSNDITNECKIFRTLKNVSTSGYLTSQCVPEKDISTSKTFSFNVYVSNNKGTPAKLAGSGDYNYAKLQISTDGSTWTNENSFMVKTTDIAKNSSATFTIKDIQLNTKCTSLGSTQYYFRVTCGQTGGEQTWKYKINSSDTYISCGKVKTGVTPAWPVQQTSPDGYSLLGDKEITAIYFEIS